jgi:hypothetical protein
LGIKRKRGISMEIEDLEQEMEEARSSGPECRRMT